jgi:histidine triad (HIT) family protein
MSCLFCDIAAGNIPAEIVWRGNGALAFLDNRPLFPGHVLLIPERHVVTLADLPGDRIAAFFESAQRLERAVESAMEAEGSFIAINTS